MPYYEYDFGLIGLFKLIFKKKTCPQCGQKLKRETEKEYLGKKKDAFNGYSTDAYHVSIRYHCETCGVDYQLKDL